MTLRFVLLKSLVVVAVATTLIPASRAADDAGPLIKHAAVKTAIPGQSIVIRARITDPDGVFAPSVFLRLMGTQPYRSIRMRSVSDAGDYEVRIGAAEVAGEGLEYFVEAFDTLGNGPSRIGSPNAPLRVQFPAAPLPRAEAASPLVSTTGGPASSAATTGGPASSAAQSEDSGVGSWWIWTLVGVVVAGAVAGAAVALSQTDGPVDAVSVDVRGPDPTDGL